MSKENKVDKGFTFVGQCVDVKRFDKSTVSALVCLDSNWIRHDIMIKNEDLPEAFTVGTLVRVKGISVSIDTYKPQYPKLKMFASGVEMLKSEF